MGFRDQLKSLVPPSANTFHSFAVESKEAFDQISTRMAEISAQVKSGAEQFQALKHYPPQERDDIVWLGHELEYNAARDCGFFQAVQDEEFKERYLKLVTGLDEESVETVNRIITRLQICITCAEGIVPLKIFNPVEKEYFLFLQNEFFPSILKISDDCYAYKQYRLPINHFEPCVFLDKHGLAKVERKIEEFEDKDIVDAGGFIGDSVLILSPLTKRNVYTFEPISDNYNLMLHTMEMNGIENAVCEKKALGSKPGTLTFNIAGSCSNQWPGSGYSHENVPVVTLDDYVAEHNLDVGLIKVDLGGSRARFSERRTKNYHVTKTRLTAKHVS